MLDRFLSTADAECAERTLRKLARHDLSRWALTGGFATEIHFLRRGLEPLSRTLTDIDFIASSFDAIPQTLAEDFLIRHVHPLDPPGKTMAQFVDPDSLLRIDVFRAFGDTMIRTTPLCELAFPIQLISLEDLLARAARLAFDIAGGVPTPPKYARDFLRLATLVDGAKVEDAWREQRRPGHSATFAETRRLLEDLIPASQHLLITRPYSTNPAKVCHRCRPDTTFRLADPNAVLALLGYC
jgi:hypothetical protein